MSGHTNGVEPEGRWRKFASLYLLGIGGPIDDEGIGHVERFAWRFLVRTGAQTTDAVLAFSTMPRLMAFTRAVNGATPHAVSTEALKVDTHRIAREPAIEIEVDLAPSDFAAWLGGATLVERIVPELER